MLVMGKIQPNKFSMKGGRVHLREKSERGEFDKVGRCDPAARGECQEEARYIISCNLKTV